MNLSVTPALQMSLLGAAPTKEAALATFIALAAAALLSTGTLGLALASGSWETGAAAIGGEIVWRNSSVCNRGSWDALQVTSAPLL